MSTTTTSTETTAAAIKDYTGHCHCRAVSYTLSNISSETFAKPIQCNCSICVDRGQLVAFVPAASITFNPPECIEKLKDYRFGKRMVAYKFCTECGSHVMGMFEGEGQFKGMNGVNLRCVDGLDLENIEVTKYNGKDL